MRGKCEEPFPPRRYVWRPRDSRCCQCSGGPTVQTNVVLIYLLYQCPCHGGAALFVPPSIPPSLSLAHSLTQLLRTAKTELGREECAWRWQRRRECRSRTERQSVQGTKLRIDHCTVPLACSSAISCFPFPRLLGSAENGTERNGWDGHVKLIDGRTRAL